ncbi:MAG: hypothetical protein M3443_08075 [Actinomycetota bacterium]|nr:hypothetical protein [Actinomycetota bacterium]
MPENLKPYAKTVVAAAIAGLTILHAAITDGVTGQEWVQIALAVLGVLGVYAATNKPKPE